MTYGTLRRFRISRMMPPAILVLPLLSATAAHSQTYTLSTVATFNGSGNGSAPEQNLTIDSSGNLYGTTRTGGPNGYGTAFKIAAGTNTITTLATFNGSGAGNGVYPSSPLLLDSSGNLYGSTTGGGPTDEGEIFKIAAGTNALTKIATFNGFDGSDPTGPMVLDGSGNLYGATYQGGTSGNGSMYSGYGTIYKIAAGTNTLTTVYNFTSLTVGDEPVGLISDSSGNLYGVTGGGGDVTQSGGYGDGTVFKIAAGTGTLTTIATFEGSNGTHPESLILDSAGNLYGTTSYGGTGSGGTVFKIAAGTSTITDLANFSSAAASMPAGITIDSKGNLYGTTEEYQGSTSGTVFEIAAGTNALTTIANFTGTNESSPDAGVTLDSSGDLFGTAASGGDANGDGTVFKLTPTGSTAAPEPAAFALLLPALSPLLLPGVRRRLRIAQS